VSVGLSRGDAAGVGTPSGRSRLRRLSVGHLAVGVAAILAFVANLAFLRSQDDTTLVMVAARDVAAGETLTAADLGTARVKAEGDILSSLVTSADALEGKVAARGIVAGTLISAGDVLEGATPDGLASMAIPIDPSHAAGGLIRPGDRVDLVDVTREGGASYVVRDAPVLSISEARTGALAGSGGEHLVIGVTADQVLDVAEAIADGSVDVVVTTGVDGG
jgi:Flp pilus assembly protein CpaB